MTDGDRFLRLAAAAIIRQEGVRIVKSPPIAGMVPEWAPGWDDWDEVLAGDRPGVRPSIFAFRSLRGDDEASMRQIYESLVARVASNMVGQLNTNLAVRTVAIFCVNSIDPGAARKLANSAPSRFYHHVKPELWIADLSTGVLYGPRSFWLVRSPAQRAAQAALTDSLQSATDVDVHDLQEAASAAHATTDAFMTALRSNVPFVTYAVLFACCAVFVIEAQVAPSCWLNPVGGICNRPQTWTQFGAMQPILVQHGQWWRLFTEMFVHFGLLHILFNGIALYSLGSLVERIYGSVRYAVIYLVSGLFASAASTFYLIAANESHQVAGGASGAIFGIAGVVVVLALRRQSIVPRPIAIQLSMTTGALIVMNLLFDAVDPTIDIRAHLGGLVVGVILGYILMPVLRPKSELEVLQG